jgi:hypothetical protein
MTDDLSHADVWDVWVQLEDQMAEHCIARQSYGEEEPPLAVAAD